MERIVLLEREENIAIITLNDPEKLNAVSVAMRDALYEHIVAVQLDPTIHGIILRGNGKGFCAGADLKEFGTVPSVIEKRKIRIQHDIWEEFRRCPKPIAAILHGFAVGSGIEMAMICDFRFAAPKTKISLPECALGMLPAAGGTQSLPRLMRHGWAIDFAMKGYYLSAEEAKVRQIVTDIFEEEHLFDEVLRFMKRVTTYPKAAQQIKRLISFGLDRSLEQGLAFEQTLIKENYKQRLV
ncbi:enoyl-CoA hydratase/isomerase family protein [Lysinibacillus sp. KU-BSD001]|uniref:enoyl-CoA hydratase/isomerase family protein n=1 Tax=Lysinibacillus sp. KU-BSD001 TaxID=3141328 RepID=UPI0036EF2CE6